MIPVLEAPEGQFDAAVIIDGMAVVLYVRI